MSTTLPWIAGMIGTLLGGGALWRILFFRQERDSLAVRASSDALNAVQLSLERLQSDLQHAYNRIDHLTRENEIQRDRLQALEAVLVYCSDCPHKEAKSGPHFRSS